MWSIEFHQMEFFFNNKEIMHDLYLALAVA